VILGVKRNWRKVEEGKTKGGDEGVLSSIIE
jgi:hypothetical protein